MTKQLTIRFAKKEDLNDLVRLCRLHANFEKSVYDTSGKLQKLDKHLFSDTPSLYCLVAEKEGEIIGYTTYMKQFSTWDADFYIYMDCLFMMEGSRGLGIGEKLVDTLKQEAKRLNCAIIQWQTPDFNVRAIKFYKRIGAYSKAKERFFLHV